MTEGPVVGTKSTAKGSCAEVMLSLIWDRTPRSLPSQYFPAAFTLSKSDGGGENGVDRVQVKEDHGRGEPVSI